MTRTTLRAEQSSGVQDFKKDVREAFSEAGKKSEEETEQNLATAGKDAKTLVNKAGDAIKNIGKDAQDQIDTTAQNAKKQ
eukprot:19717-Heterococcus_DN1.PRE.3